MKLWAVIAAACGQRDLTAALLAARMPMAFVAGWFMTRNWDVVRLWWLIPARDLFAFEM